MKNSLFSLLVLSTALVTALPALAAGDVEKVKSFATRVYEQQKNHLLARGVQIKEKGELTVTDKDKYYAVAYPALTITSENMNMVLGAIQMNVMPGDMAGQWKITTAIPNPIKMRGLDDKATAADFNIGSQNFSAVIDDTTLFPQMVDARYQNMTLTAPGQQGGMTLGDLTIKINYAKDQHGLLSGPFAFGFNNLVLNDEPTAPTPKKLQVGSMLIDGTVDQLDMAMLHKYNEKMGELTQSGFDPEKVKTPQSMNAMWKIVMDYGLQQMDGIKANVTLKNIEVTENGKTASHFKLPEFNYHLEALGMRGDKSHGNFSFRLSGLEGSGIAPEFTSYTPKNISFSFDYKDLPHKALMQQLGSLASSGVAMENCDGKDAAKCNKQNAQMMAMQAMMTVPALMAQAGTVFTVKDTKVETSNYALTLDGAFTAAQAAMFGGTGTAKLIFTGLDQLVEDLHILATKPDAKPDVAAKATQAAQSLAAMQMFGQLGTDSNGKPARTYEFNLDEKGTAKLNGTDVSMLMGKHKKDTAPEAVPGAPDATDAPNDGPPSLPAPSAQP